MPSEGTLKKRQKAVAISSILGNIAQSLAPDDYPFARLGRNIVEQNKGIAQSIDAELQRKKAKKKRKSGLLGGLLGMAGSVLLPAAAPALGIAGGALGGGIGSVVGQAIGGGGIDPVNAVGSSMAGGIGAAYGNQIRTTPVNSLGQPAPPGQMTPLVPWNERTPTSYAIPPSSFGRNALAYLQGYNSAMGYGSPAVGYTGMLPSALYNPYERRY